MRMIVPSVVSLALIVGIVCPSYSNADEFHKRVFFLHHSTGRNLVEEGDAREYLDERNIVEGTDIVLWDHDYNYIGLSDFDGDQLGYNYAIPNDNTDPIGLHELWTTANSARDSLLSRNDVIAFKSCFPASDIYSEARLDQYKIWYLEMRDFFDTQPGKIFLVMSPPPLHRLATDVDTADRARRFADWLMSDEYLAGHPNMFGFDFFNLLAHPNDGSVARNMLRYEYERSHSSSDSHPNVLANQTAAPHFIDALMDAALPSTSAVRTQPLAITVHGNHPNPFNPATLISFNLIQDEWVDLQVIDIHGRKVRTLWQGNLNSGEQQLLWDGKDDHGKGVSSGIYLYQVTTSGSMVSGKMVLAR